MGQRTPWQATLKIRNGRLGKGPDEGCLWLYSDASDANRSNTQQQTEPLQVSQINSTLVMRKRGANFPQATPRSTERMGGRAALQFGALTRLEGDYTHRYTGRAGPRARGVQHGYANFSYIWMAK